jgi:hypothetical protein
MSAKEDRLFQEWINNMLDEVEDGEKEALKQWAALPVAREVYRGTLAQEKLYTELNKIDSVRRELADREAELNEWFEAEKPKNAKLLAERDALRAQVETLGTGDAPAAAGTGLSISPEDLAELKATKHKLDTLDKLLPAVLGDVARMVKDSVDNKFDIDPREAIKLSVQRGIEPWSAYLDLTADQRAERATAAKKAEQQKWFDEGKRSVTTNSPDHLQPSGPSVVDYLQSLNKATGAQGAAVAPQQADRVSAALSALQEVDVSQLS